MAKKSSTGKWSKWIPLIAAFLIPGAGHVLLGKSKRGLLMVFWMLIFGFLTFQLTGENISFVGRFSGGFAVWVISILEVHRISSS